MPHRLDFIFRALFSVFAFSVSVALVSLAAEHEWPAGRVVPLLLIVVTMVLVLLRAPVALPLIALLLGLVTSILVAEEPNPGAPGLFLGVMSFLIVLELRKRVAIAWLGALAVAYVGFTLSFGPAGYGWAAVDDTVLTVGLWLVGAVFVDALLRSGEAVSKLRSERIEGELALGFARTNNTITATLRRVLHDEVIGTLVAVADHRPTGTAQEPCPIDDRLRSDCGRVAASLATQGATERHAGGPLADLVEDLDRQTPVVLQVQGDASVRLSAVQADAVGRALGEALRNVARHAATPAAVVRWHVENGEVCLRVADQGPGSRAPARPAWGRSPVEGFGLRASVQEPLAAIGGRATLARSEGGGTVLTMWWPAPSTAGAFQARTALEAAHLETHRAIADQQWLVLFVAVPVLACNGWLAVRYSWGDRWWLEQLVLAAVVIVGTVAVGWRIRRGFLPPAAVVALSVGVAAVVHVQILLAGGSQTLRDYNSYAVGLSAMVLTICAFYTPLAWSLLVAAPLIAVVVGHAVVGDLTLGESGGAIIAALTPPLLGHVFGAYLRWSRQQQDVEEHRLKELAAEAHRKELEQVLAGRQLARARQVVGPWLLELSTGRRDLHDPEVVARARAFAQSVRDDLHVPGVLDTVLSARIDLARIDGTDVVFEATDGEVEHAAPCLRLLDRLLDLGPAIERIQLRLPEKGRPSGSITILPPPDAVTLDRALSCLRGWAHDVRSDEFAALVTIHHLHGSHDAALDVW